MASHADPPRLEIHALLADYRAGRRRPTDVALDVLERLEGGQDAAWITTVAPAELLAAAAALDDADPALPLYGIPFAVKDNIDVAGLPTTAACPGFAYVPETTATAVRLLLEAGALLVGKTNLDQFATGLVGTRSPYGACSAADDPDRVSGGSSSGSAVAVALGQVAFALGTDTAGSGRVPAAFNGLVGVKPTRGLVSTHGLVPACASLDCVSILVADLEDAERVLEVIAGIDPLDSWSRPAAWPQAPPRRRIGVPLPGQAELEEEAAARAWAAALARAAAAWTLVPVDVTPLLEAAPLHYAAWVAERTSDLGGVLAVGPAGLDPVVAEIIGRGGALTAVSVFEAMHRLAELRLEAAPIWEAVDALLLPTTPMHPTHAQVAAEPLAVNDRLGRFTNFVNLLDLAALALPGPRRDDGLPFGVTLHAPAFHDRRLLALGRRWTRRLEPRPVPDLAPAGEG